jgi:hypothetical protein
VRIRGRWHDAAAHVVDDDDPRARLRNLGSRSNAAAVRVFGSDLLTIRIDLDE